MRPQVKQIKEARFKSLSQPLHQAAVCVSVLLLSARTSSLALLQNETITVQKWQIVTAQEQVRQLSTVASLNWQRENNQKRAPWLHLSSSICGFRYCFCSFSMEEHRRTNKDRWNKQVLVWLHCNICIQSLKRYWNSADSLREIMWQDFLSMSRQADLCNQGKNPFAFAT